MSATAKPEQAGTALTLPQRAAAALGTAKVEGELRALAAKHTALTVITNDAGRADCHSARMELKNQRLAIEKLGKAAREDAQQFAKACIGEENRLVAIIAPEEKRLQGLQDAWDEKIAAEKAAKERAEQERVRKIAEALDDIGGMPLRYVGASVADLADALVRLREMTPEVWAQEFTDKAKETIQSAITKVEQMHAAAVAAAAEAQRQAEERARLEAEQKRIAEEKAALERQQAEARAAEEAARKAREEAEAAHRLKLEQEARAARERAEAEDRERRRKLDDEEAARRKALQEEEDLRRAAAKAEEERLAAQRRELEEAQRRQRDENEARERAAREAEEARQAAERDRRRAEQDAREEVERQARLHRAAVQDGHALLRNFCEEYGKLSEFQGIAAKVQEWLDEQAVPA